MSSVLKLNNLWEIMPCINDHSKKHTSTHIFHHTPQKVWIALEAARAPYELQEVALYGAGGKPDWFWDLNPDGTVPVLVCHGGAVVYPDSDLALESATATAGICLSFDFSADLSCAFDSI